MRTVRSLRLCGHSTRGAVQGWKALLFEVLKLTGEVKRLNGATEQLSRGACQAKNGVAVVPRSAVPENLPRIV
jgi:hypothetical protein